MPNTTQQDIDRQIAIEEEFKADGVERSRAAVVEALSSGNVGQVQGMKKLLNTLLPEVEKAIDELKEKKGGGASAKYRGHIRKIDTPKLAALTTHFMVSAICRVRQKDRFMRTICTQLGQIVQTESLGAMAEKVSKAYMEQVDNGIAKDNVTSTNDIKRRIKRAADALHLEAEPWCQTEQMHVGKLLAEILFNQGLFTWQRAAKGMYAEPDEGIKQYLKDIVNNAKHMTRVPPMVVKPIRHEDMYNGGYFTNICNRHTFHNRRATREDKRRINAAFKKAEGLKEMLNRTQEVPYRINTDILHWVTEAQKVGFTMGMPSAFEVPMPPFPASLENRPKDGWNEEDHELFKEWKADAMDAREAEHNRRSKIISINTTLAMCRRFKDEPELYFPTCCDWRYRLYFKPTLSLQGMGVQKALIRFAECKPLGERGLMWLKAHVACCFGYDKYLPEVCAKWTEDRMELIRAFVADPLNAMQDDEPDDFWGMLAASIELVRALDSEDPTKYASFIAVSRDATNSVGQHYSAMMRDPEGGELTNLIYKGGETKADLYLRVKGEVDKALQEMVDNRDNIVEANYWLENPVTRAMTKKPTMTFFYKSKHKSRAKYLQDEAEALGYQPIDGYSLRKLSSFLATPVAKAIKATLPLAVEGMDYISRLSKLVPADKCLEFTTAMGGLVIHRYPKCKERRLKVRSMGVTFVTVEDADWSLTNPNKNATAAPPNVIHQADAAHLGLIINNANCSILPIHDQIATHACDVDHMNKVAREQFVNLYENYKTPIELVEDYLDSIGVDYSEVEKPIVGNLDIREVINSPFFFC